MLKKLINKYELSSDTRSLKENEIFFDLGTGEMRSTTNYIFTT